MVRSGSARHQIMRRKALLFLCLVVLAGCAGVTTVNRAELDQLKAHWREPKVSLWYYMGSRDGYHYFHHSDLGGDKTYRISDKELAWQGTAPFTENQKKWKVLKWGVYERK